MEVGKLYKSIHTGMVVRCTIPRFGESFSGSIFSGVVVEKGEGKYDLGHHSGGWVSMVFEEYTPTQALAKEQIYDIPEGYKATIKNGQVLIESNTKYIKHEFEGFVRYWKHVEDDRTTIITLDCNGNTEISHIGERPCPDISGRVKEIDENEFMEAYKKALKNIGL